MTEIYGAIVALAAAFGGAWYGGRLQRSNDEGNLAFQLRIGAASKFLGTVGEFQFTYGSAWAPDTLDLGITERHRPIFAGVMALRADAGAMGVVGPDDLRAIAAEIVRLAGDRGLATSFDAMLTEDLAAVAQRFELAARSLSVTGREVQGVRAPNWRGPAARCSGPGT